MSAFNDYCMICEKICQSNEVYCSENCKVLDLQSKSKSQSLSHLPNTHLHSHRKSSSIDTYDYVNDDFVEDMELDNHNNSNIITTTQNQLISPLLTPNFTFTTLPKSGYNNYTFSSSRVRSNSQIQVHSPLSNFSYDSPILLNSSVSSQYNNDLDLNSNKLDLNISNHNQTMKSRNCSMVSPSSTVNRTISTNVSDLLSNCASENYKKWLSSSITKH